MGNTMDIKLKEDNNVLEITESMIRDFQGLINLLDHSMTGFAKSIDAMRSSCEIVIQHVNSNESKEQESIVSGEKNVLDTSQLPIRLLETIDESVSDYKFVVMESISKLCHSILEIGNSYTVSSAESLIELSVDKYRDQHIAASNGMQYCDVRIEVLQKEVKYLKKAYQISRSHMENFNKREDIYQQEKNYMKKKNEELETNLGHLKSERDILINENSTKGTRNEEQKKEIEDLKNMSKQLESELNEERSEKYNVDEKHKFEMNDKVREIDALKEEEKLLKEEIMMIDEMKTEINTITEQNITIQTDLERGRHKNESLIEEKSSMIESLNTDKMKMNRELNELKQAFENHTQKLKKQHVEDEKRATEVLLEQVATLEKEKERANVEKVSSEQKSVKLQSDIRYLETEKEKKMEALELELEMLKKKKVVHVQVYHQYAYDAPTALEELLTLLKNKLTLQCVDLEIIRIDKLSHLNQDIPMLISCSRTYHVRLDKPVTKALNGFKERSKRMAVIIFNRKDEAALLMEVEKYGEETDEALGGVFNIGYKDTIYSCPYNDQAIDEILAFIDREGHKRSKVVESSV